MEISPDHQSRCFLGDRTLQVPWNEYYRGRKRLLDREENGAAAHSEGVAAKILARAEKLKIWYEHRSRSLASMFGMEKKRYVKAVDDISLEVKKGCTLGIVGESGCGKSTLVKGLVGLEKLAGGSAELMGMDISGPVAGRSMEMIRQLQMVFQNPDSTLNPSFTVGRQIARPLRKFGLVPRGQVRKEAERLLSAVKLDAYYYDRYPRQLSGGEKQRVGIARAMAGRPSMVICDEPVSALDVSVQAAVLNLLNEIKEEQNATMIFIAHDLSVVRFISDFVAVMYLGQIVEFGPVESIYPPPYHPYTEALLSSVPIPDPESRRKPIALEGEVPSPMNRPSGCCFHTRCPRRNLLPDRGAICEHQAPEFQRLKNGHRILCHIPAPTLTQLAQERGDRRMMLPTG
ncbi:MAG: ABC transporter ATP-binding protein [Desulfobacterales bacterium]|nr:ABC transporter ATP-binding protein [Desulfobacterales bacterium]